MTATHTAPCGGRLVTADGRELPLRGTALSADARGGIARVNVEQRFRNDAEEPLRVTYSLPLPHEAAVSGFAFRIGNRRVVGEIDKRESARERFEEALLEGRTAALLEQDRSTLFTQEVGNIPPGAEVVAELTIDQRLQWQEEGAWEWRFPTVVAPRYLGEEGRVADGERITQDVAETGLPGRLHLELVVHDELAERGVPRSPSHAVTPTTGDGLTRIAFGDEGGVRLDRDVVVRWPVAGAEPGATLATARPDHAEASAHGLLTLVPPRPESAGEAVGRDLIVLLDTSGSMHGPPLHQAKAVVAGLVRDLTDADTVELLAFASHVERFSVEPVRADETGRARALRWLEERECGGATEMGRAIVEALSPLTADSQRQVVLVTDGYIGFEKEIINEVLRRLPRESRLFTVGVGPAPNRSLTGPAARAGRGMELVVGIHEDGETPGRKLLARTRAPLLVDVEIGGSAVIGHAPSALPDVLAGAPAVIALELRPEGGQVQVRGRTAARTWSRTLEVAPVEAGSGSEAVSKLFARERVEDLEMRIAAGESRQRLDGEIERIGLAHAISTRLTSWVAVSEEPDVDPSKPIRRVKQPQELADGLSAEGLGLREVAAAACMPKHRGRVAAATRMLGMPQAASPGAMDEGAFGPRPPRSTITGAPRKGGLFGLFGWVSRLLRRGGRPLAVRASALVRRGDRLTLELTLPAKVRRWQPGRRAELVGERLNRTLSVLADAGTAVGPVRERATVRLVVELPAEHALEPGTTLLLECDDDLLTIELPFDP